MSGGWVTICELATIASRTERALELAFSKISRGQATTWCGAHLVVRRARGRGGRSGLHYEVLESSLPLGLQEALKAYRAAFEAPSKPGDDTAAERDWWSLILSAAAARPKHSRERAAAIVELLSRPLTDWNGQAFAPSARTIHRKLDAYERGGAMALAGRERRDKGVARVIISARWDSTVPFDRATRERIAETLRAYVRGLYKDGASTKLITTLAGKKLRELTAAAGCEFMSAMSELTFAMPRPFIEGERVFRNVAIFTKDRKAYEDARPRIRRTREGLEPMQVVVGDVHHLDIVMRRPDGSEAWPKAIAWLDLATNRVWLDVVLLGKGEGIRNADVIASFILMVTAWGMPRTLYLDNGSEYRWSEFIDDAMQLVDRIDGNGDDRHSRIIRAKPYNAPAKAIEGIFKVIEYTYFRSLLGWAGGDRTNKKTAKVGHATEPFPGTIDELRVLIGHCLALYEATSQRGALGNRSPRQVYDSALADGWQRVTLDARELRTVFATSETRRVRQGAIEYGGEPWTCPELETYLCERVTIRVPKFEEAATVLPLLDDTGKVFAFAVPATRYGILDKAGARESGRIARAHRQAIRQLDQVVPTIAAHAEIAHVASGLLPPPSAPSAGIIRISDEAAEIAAGMSEKPTSREMRRIRKAEADQRKLVESTSAFSELLFRRQK